jgi:hypothetical protein
MPGGRHEIRWDGLDRAGMAAASGVYLYRLQTDEVVLTRSMLLVR